MDAVALGFTPESMKVKAGDVDFFEAFGLIQNIESSNAQFL